MQQDNPPSIQPPAAGADARARVEQAGAYAFENVPKGQYSAGKGWNGIGGAVKEAWREYVRDILAFAQQSAPAEAGEAAKAYDPGYDEFRNKWIGDQEEMCADLVRLFVPRATPGTTSGRGDALRETIAALLLGTVNAPEQEIYRVAGEIAALANPPASPGSDAPAGGGDREAGTFRCPICGESEPHHHTAPVVSAYRNKRSRK